MRRLIILGIIMLGLVATTLADAQNTADSLLVMLTGERFARDARVLWTPEQRALVQDYCLALSELSSCSSIADSLRRFFLSSAAPSSCTLSTQRFEARQVLMSPTSFYLCPVQPIREDGGVTVGARYLPSSRTMQLSDVPRDRFLRGLILVHELRHAYDRLLLHQNEPYRDDTWYDNEVRTEMMVSAAFNQCTGGQWDSLIGLMAVWQGDLCNRVGLPSESCSVLIPSFNDVVRVGGLFSSLTGEVTVTLTRLAILMANIGRLSAIDAATVSDPIAEVKRRRRVMYKALVYGILEDPRHTIGP